MLNLNQLLITVQQSISKVIKPTPQQQQRQSLTRYSLDQPMTLEEVSDEYFCVLLLNNLPPSPRQRR
jgi:hypothetical protein